jgi:signal transduction histidine kinase
MKAIQKPWIILGLFFGAILLFILSFFAEEYKISWQRDESLLLNKIRKNIASRVSIINGHIINVEKQLNDNTFNFSTLNEINDFPVFVFQNDSLISWNSQHYIPNPVNIKSKKEQQLLISNTGKYIVFKREITQNGKIFKILSLIQLTYKFPINNKYLKSGINTDIFPSESVKINNYQSKHNLYDGEGNFIFSVEFPETTITLSVFSIIFIIISIFLLLISFSSLYFYLKNHRKNETKSTVLLSTFLFFLGNKSRWIIGKGGSLVLYFLMVFSSGILLVFISQIMLYFYNNDVFTLDITKILIANTWWKLITFIFFIFSSILYFLVIHFTVKFRHFQRSKINFANALVIDLGVFLVMGVISFLTIKNLLFIVFIHILYVSVVYHLKLISTLSRIRYVTYMYFFICAIICCLSSTYSYYYSQKENLFQFSKKTATSIIKEEKLVDEKIFAEISDAIGNDKFILSILENPLTDKSLIERKITKYYLKESVEKYDVKIYFFDLKGNSIDENAARNYFSILNSLNTTDYKTLYNSIYKQRGLNSGYFCAIKLKSDTEIISGYLLIELRLKKIIPYSILPELVTNRPESGQEYYKYSYAVYEKKNFISAFGAYNYQKKFKKLDSDITNLTENGYDENFYTHHQLIHFQDDKDVLVSTEFNIFKNTLSNFSFIFLLTAFLLAFVIISNTFYYKLRQVSSTFTTKIQIFINFAFFIPLFVISITVFYIISYSYKNELENNFVVKAENAANFLMQKFSKPIKKADFEPSVMDKIYETARFSQSDLNIYDNTGKLLVSSQPLLFEKAIISERVHPQAIISLTQNRENYVLIEEKIGQLKFNTVYQQIKSVKTGEMIGILAIPFYGSDKEIRSKILETLLVVINIFTILFLIFLIASFAASRWLTSPLSMLTKKIKQTTLSIDNEPLIYNSKDEIGILVSEYNQMLKKLADSKKALSATEKEAAWREMAKQVAHEIKNPLTPMKLMLQNLQRIIAAKDERAPEYTQKTVETLLEQVDNLSDIAGSFSAFTQMPVPIREKIEIVNLLKKTIFLLNSNIAKFKIEFECKPTEIVVEADGKLLSRIFINLITNALEAERDKESHLVKVELQIEKEFVIVKIIDNGIGIEPSMESKIFQPNFSTKTTGSGIGLAVAKRGIEQMGGNIWFETELGIGTTFFVKLKIEYTT